MVVRSHLPYMLRKVVAAFHLSVVISANQLEAAAGGSSVTSYCQCMLLPIIAE